MIAVIARPTLDRTIIDEVNKHKDWVAGHNDRFDGVDFEEAKKLCGTLLANSTELDGYVRYHKVGDIPTSFDARQKWPNCIHPIRDQQQCGSCWAFGATEALSDRICIAGGPNVVLSPQHMVSCDKKNYGCQGGYLNYAWQFMVDPGVCTDECMPYTSGGGSSGTCPNPLKCTGSGTWKTYQAKNWYSVPKSVEQIQTELMTHGPMEVAFNVYQDFFSYKSGVYKHKSGGLAGGHAVKLIGWGVDGNQPYWIIANSWGTSWGMNGLFWIARGTNECGIESNVIAGLPKV